MSKEEALLARIIDIFAQRFEKHAVLRGGMVLRVLGCERMTNDVDYVFVPFKSKKDIVADVLQALENIEGAEISYSMNSKCLRVIVGQSGVAVQIEAKTAPDVSTAIVSTKELASAYGLPPRLVAVVDYPIALANKMAAWNERRLIRDVYDIWFYLRMGIRPDEQTLAARLAKPSYSKLVKPKDHFPGIGVREFYTFLNQWVYELTDDEIANSLSDYLPPEALPGLAMRFRVQISKIAG